MNTREQFGKYLLLKKLTEDPVGETFRAGLLGAKGMERVVLLRIFNGQGIDGVRLWQAVSGRSGVQQALKSPNIGDGVDLGAIEGIPYVAYDYISGKNMANLLEQAARKRNFIPAEHALLITERIALALASAVEARHDNERILHGFLIPHLVMISNEGETRLTGFEVGPGLRSFVANPVIRQHFGRYLAPEALAGAPIDRIDDVYSVGVILFELLTGRPLPAPNQDGFNAAIDQAVVATEGTPLPQPLADLLKQTLVPRDRRIKDIASWHKTLNKYMFEGQYNPTTFNLAFYMHNLFRQEIERESQEIEVEKTLPVPVHKPREESRPAAPPPPVPVATAAPGPMTPGHMDSTGAFLPEYARSEKSSNMGLIGGIAAAVLLLGAGGYFLFGKKEEPAPVVQVPAGPTVDDLKAQISELVSAQTSQVAADYEGKLKKLQDQLDQAQRDADARRKAEAEVARIAAATPAPSPVPTQPPPTLPTPTPEPAEVKPAEPEVKPEPPPEEVKVAEPTPAPVVTPLPPPIAKPTASQVRLGDLVEMGPGVVPPQVLRRPAPRYPEMARRFNKKSATVVVKVLVDENGQVSRAELAGPEAKFGFDAEALSSAKKAVYKPATKEGVRVKMWHTLSVEFRDQ